MEMVSCVVAAKYNLFCIDVSHRDLSILSSFPRKKKDNEFGLYPLFSYIYEQYY